MPQPDKSGMISSLMRTKRRYFILFICILALAGLAGYLVLNRWPALGAQVAKPLRGLIGNAGVARLETVFFTLQDTAKQAQYRLGAAEAAAPWQVEPEIPDHLTPDQGNCASSFALCPLSSEQLTPQRPLFPSPTTVHQPSSTATQPPITDQRSPTPPITPSPSSTPAPPSATSTPTSWTLPAVSPFGALAGEGVWQPYLNNPAGDVVAQRTFLQPDAERPYAIVAIVAFNLHQTSLHYVLGSEEPALPDGPRGFGFMDAAHKQPGTLLATFNGGFMAAHGAYGAMADGLVALPAKDGYATVTMSTDGRVQIGEWGHDISADDPYQSWRQNARLITQNGAITERVYNGSAATWGSSLTGDVVTWRSALGLSENGSVLYFAAGPSLSMPALAAAMQAVGAHNSLLLDINQSWVHFAAIHADGEQWLAEPLLPEGMDSRADRYLRQSQRDFFYVTVRP